MVSAAIQSLISGSREFLRDYPIFFELDTGMDDSTTLRLPHPLISGDTLQVVTFDSSQAMIEIPSEEYQVDERNGLLKLDLAHLGKRIMVNGYHFTWFLDGDLAFHAQRSLIDVSYGQNISSFDEFTPIEVDTIIMGTMVSALWSLVTELALDIDVSTPEGMYIPARQRYAQATQMWASYSAELQKRMEALNLGVGRLEIFWLRRVAKLTNRLVPLYQTQEIDDRRRPKRIYPEIPQGVPPGTPVTPDYPTVRGPVTYPIPPDQWGGWGPPITTTSVDEVAVQAEEPTESSIQIWVDME